MPGISIQTTHRVIPMVYAYSTPEIARHDGHLKIGYTDRQSVEDRVHQQGHIHHLYTVFDERNPGATGNRYLICFTSEKQAKKKPVLPPVIADTHEDGPIFSEDEEAPTGK